MNVDINDHDRKKDDDDEDDKYIIVAADNTGIKVTNRDQRMDEKWDVQRKKGYLKVHVAVNTKTKEILVLEATMRRYMMEGC